MPIRPSPGSSRRQAWRWATASGPPLRLALSTKLLVITGGPGVGKTTLVNAILRILLAKNMAIALARTDRPSGKATGRGDRARGEDHPSPAGDRPGRGGFRRNEDHPLDCDLLVVDETSMVDVPLMHALLKAIPDERR